MALANSSHNKLQLDVHDVFFSVAVDTEVLVEMIDVYDTRISFSTSISAFFFLFFLTYSFEKIILYSMRLLLIPLGSATATVMSG